MHDKQEHPGKHTDLSKLKKGGMAMKKMDTKKMATGGQARLKAKGEHPVQKRAKEGAEMIKMKKGGKATTKMCGGGMKGKK
jgi:hypothetical protein